MGAVNVLATAAALLLMDRCGRRTLIMWSSAGMFLSCIVIVLALLNFFSKTVAIAGVASYVTFFEIGLGPIPVSTFLTGNSIYALNIALTYIYTFPFSGLL